jgi:hypothetical protein
MKPETRIKGKDGWYPVLTSGTIYYQLFDDGEHVITCPRKFMEELNIKSGLAVFVSSDIQNIISDFI